MAKIKQVPVRISRFAMMSLTFEIVVGGVEVILESSSTRPLYLGTSADFNNRRSVVV